MSDTSEATVRRLRQDSPTVDDVCQRLEREVSPEEAELVVSFAEIFFSKAIRELLQKRSSDGLAHLVMGAWRFLQRSRPDRVDVEVFNPDVDNEGWYAPVTVLRTHISERPFIVDSLREFLHTQDLGIESLIYPVIHVERGEDGEITAVRPSREGAPKESLVHCEVARVADPELQDYLGNEASRRLQDVVRATDDFQPMIHAVNGVVAELAERMSGLEAIRDKLAEIQAFLRWLRDGGFVFLGYRVYDLVDAERGKAIVVERGSGLGVLRNEADSAYAEPVLVSDLKPGLRDLAERGPHLIISKTNALSTVHRLVRMDYIGVKKLSPDGEVLGEHRFVGLFTSKAYSEEAENIPIVRRKLELILENAGAAEGSHDYKEIKAIFSSMPKEELFVSSEGQISDEVQVVLTSYHAAEVRVMVQADPLRRGFSVMVIIPKDRFSGEVRRAIEEALVRRLQGEVLNYHLALGEGGQARLHFYMAAPGEKIVGLDSHDLENLVRELIRSWSDRVRAGLENVRSPDEARRLTHRYGESFGPEYRAAAESTVAVQDILELEAMLADNRMVSISFSPGRAEGEGGATTELKLYLRGGRLILSDFMPILENAGLRVIAVVPYEIKGQDAPDSIIYSFSVQDSAGQPLDVEHHGTRLAEAILAVRFGDATNDRLNALVLLAGLSWREVDVLRAYVSYAFQLGAVPSRRSLPAALVSSPNIARVFLEIFKAKFDLEGPATKENREAIIKELRGVLTKLMTSVTLLADDRALRRMVVVLDATVRTNYFRNGGSSPTRRSGGVPYISFKVSAKALRDVTRTRLLYEVWVRSSRMEGVHLRGARVARGGIRYSDRPYDFRTEILGLVNTQMVKNAVIVPAGSKGGYITLRKVTDPNDMADEAREQYKTLIRGLLDLTDNLDHEGNIIPPEHVVCWDKPDPYLVVAADKGTAQYSDVANGVAAEYDFWLGDAFASGGSQGYDHKVVGITAGGAWECVKRHFRERGKDIQAEPFTVVGIGDMSGDVFGNGMLRSGQIKLIAAFDHRHVFIDPDPDPEASFRERQRLFALERSSWDDYDRDCLSPGAMIVPRGAKEVDLTPEARRAAGVPDDVRTLDGEALIRAVLRAPAELLWNGGIGTYVRAPFESHADAGDPPNDAVRVSSDELRVRIVGEGGNLGLTQRARIDFALRGGRLNTDALDNSGGVDLSDREVNLKILLRPPVRVGTMSEEQRNRLLEDLTDSVAWLVLADNESQGLAISLDELRANAGPDDFRDLMSALEKRGGLDRLAEHLPTWEVLVDRLEEHGRSLTRPELCVLLAYAKMQLMSQLLKSGLPDDAATEHYVLQYFPKAAVKAAGEEGLRLHRLRREIVACQLTNELVGLMGATFVNRVSRDTGREAADVARAWLVAARLAGHRELVGRVRGAEGGLSSKVAYRWLLGLSRVLERTTRWLLENVTSARSTATLIDENREKLESLRKNFGDFVAGEDKIVYEHRVAEIERHGAEPGLARKLITLRFLDQLLEILRVARETGSEPLEAGRAYYRVSESFHIPWLRQAIFGSASEDRWEQRAVLAMAADLSRAHSSLTRLAIASEDGGAPGPPAAEYGRFRKLMEEIRAEESMSVSGLSVAVREISGMAERVNEPTE